ncbi:MAG: hypothetical protein ABIQ39_01830, partial [Ilumatobacteraceae bacterium]
MNVFVAARGNEFMADIAAWIAEAAVLAGRESHVVRDGLPEADGCANLVVAPHEFFELHSAPRRQMQLAAAASVCICTEQPGTRWFDLTVDAARMGLVAFDINAHGVRALRQRGINAHRLQL